MEDLREWSARVMGYYIYRGPIFESDIVIFPCIVSYQDKCTFFESNTREERKEWAPDKDLNQCFMLVGKMKELGWFLSLTDLGDEWEAEFCDNRGVFLITGSNEIYGRGTAPALAILRAAKVTGV